MTINIYNPKFLISLIFTLSFAICGATWADEATTAGSADRGSADREIFKSEGIVSLKCSTGGFAPVEGVKVACKNPSGASLCGGAGSSGGGKNKVPTKKSTGGSETSGIQVSKVMFDCLNKIIPICAKKAGCSDDKVKLSTMGGHADRAKNTMKGDSKSPSKHCGGFAIDFAGIECSGGGKKLELTKPGRSKDKERYDGFRSCWDEEVEKNCKPLQKAINMNFGPPSMELKNSFYSLLLSLIEPAHAMKSKKAGRHSIACQGAPNPQNSKHNDHMHGSVDSPTGQPSGI